jgi:dTDP-glucose 4,6-dehydratase
MILNAQDGKPLPIYGDGGQVRDWLFVEDHCEAIWMVLRKGRSGQTYNVGGGSQPTNLEVVQHVCSTMDELLPHSPFLPHSSLMRFVPDRPGHDRRYAIDITKIKTQLGWQPKQSLGSGLQKTVEWYLSNTEWVSAIRQQQDYQQWLERNYDKRQ